MDIRMFSKSEMKKMLLEAMDDFDNPDDCRTSEQIADYIIHKNFGV